MYPPGVNQVSRASTNHRCAPAIGTAPADHPRSIFINGHRTGHQTWDINIEQTPKHDKTWRSNTQKIISFH